MQVLTPKEYAEREGITVQAAHQRAKRGDVLVVIKAGKKMFVIDDAKSNSAEVELKAQIDAKSRELSRADQEIHRLMNQLEMKDQQLNKKDQLIDQAQQLHAALLKEHHLMLESGKKSWWKRMFG
jgi:predicted site-specific integrase-resolvase